MTRNKAWLSLAVLLLASPASARDLELGAFVGWHWFADDNELGVGEGDERNGVVDNIIGGLRLGVPVFPRLTLEAELGLIPGENRADTNDDYLIVAWRGNVRVDLLDIQRFSVFALGGAGGLSTAESTNGGIDNDTDAAFHAGAGLQWKLPDDYALRLDGRAVFPPSSQGENELTNEWEALLSLVVTLGEKAPPPPPAPPPPADTDGDGINDPEDRCVTEREDRDGFQDVDGCPDPDNDQDGILDTSDQCRDEAETRNGYQDEDGCRDELPQEVQKFSGTIAGVNFATGSARLTRASTKVLDEAADVLVKYPELRVEIQGHTDDVGTHEANMKLSQDRAEAVKEYLVSKNVDAGRVTAVGYGPDQPIDPATTREARAKNRRVEFKMLTQ